jgi:hypothetical protein
MAPTAAQSSRTPSDTRQGPDRRHFRLLQRSVRTSPLAPCLRRFFHLFFTDGNRAQIYLLSPSRSTDQFANPRAATALRSGPATALHSEPGAGSVMVFTVD